MEEPDGITCEIDVTAAGFPHRSAVILERERGTVSLLANKLKGTSTRGRAQTTPAFTTRDLTDALASDADTLKQAAAYLIGRSKPADAQASGRLIAALDEVLASSKSPLLRAEAAMSKALRGQKDGAAAVLKQSAKAAASDEPWVAAAYLAQMGDASGWPAIAAAVAEDAPQHHRTAALDAAVAFGPLQGEASGDSKVDAFGVIEAATAAEAVGVRQLVPRLLREVGHPDARAIIERIAGSDASSGVRAVAQYELGQLTSP
ncbi:MAG: hypothetical protein R3F39_11685 [Myxococcota bacterium]